MPIPISVILIEDKFVFEKKKNTNRKFKIRENM